MISTIADKIVYYDCLPNLLALSFQRVNNKNVEHSRESLKKPRLCCSRLKYTVLGKDNYPDLI